MAVEIDYFEVGPPDTRLEGGNNKDVRLGRLALPNPLIDDLRAQTPPLGVLIPLKTDQEVRQDHYIAHAYITRVPTKSANDVMT
jgi:tRNA-specific adenosine deaminase 3